MAAGSLSATGAFAGYTYIVKFLGDVSGFSPSTVSVLLVVFGVACLAGVSITGALLDRFPQFALPTAVVTQAVGMLGLYSVGTHPVAAVVFLALMGGALGPVFMVTQNEMLHCAPGRTDIALAANSGAYNAGIAAGAALGALVLPYARGARHLPRRRAADRRGLRSATRWSAATSQPLLGSRSRCLVDDLR